MLFGYLLYYSKNPEKSNTRRRVELSILQLSTIVLSRFMRECRIMSRLTFTSW